MDVKPASEKIRELIRAMAIEAPSNTTEDTMQQDRRDTMLSVRFTPEETAEIDAAIERYLADPNHAPIKRAGFIRWRLMQALRADQQQPTRRHSR